MSGMSPDELRGRLGSGLLSFPVTHFDDQLELNEPAYRQHCAWLIDHGPAALFAAGGTGEFFSLTPEEVAAVVEAAAAEASRRLAIVAGCGYGTRMAVQLAQSLESAGADGLLLLPPYLVSASQEGLATHVETICRATGLGVIVYNRDNCVLADDTLAGLCERNPNLVGFKDGVGDIELMTRIRCKLGDRVVYIGGLPTAETFAPAYLAMGVTTYSSAIFNFLPEWALHFYAAVCAGDLAGVDRELRRFVLPYTALRNTRPGYAVAIVKAGMTAVGRPAGPVRPPLTDLTLEELDALRQLISALAE